MKRIYSVVMTFVRQNSDGSLQITPAVMRATGISADDARGRCLAACEADEDLRGKQLQLPVGVHDITEEVMQMVDHVRGKV